MRDQRGASGPEYVMILTLVMLVVIVAARVIGPIVNDDFGAPLKADGPTVTSVTVLGATETKDCEGKDHAHKGCK